MPRGSTLKWILFQNKRATSLFLPDGMAVWVAVPQGGANKADRGVTAANCNVILLVRDDNVTGWSPA